MSASVGELTEWGGSLVVRSTKTHTKWDFSHRKESSVRNQWTWEWVFPSSLWRWTFCLRATSPLKVFVCFFCCFFFQSSCCKSCRYIRRCRYSRISDRARDHVSPNCILPPPLSCSWWPGRVFIFGWYSYTGLLRWSRADFDCAFQVK